MRLNHKCNMAYACNQLCTWWNYSVTFGHKKAVDDKKIMINMNTASVLQKKQ